MLVGVGVVEAQERTYRLELSDEVGRSNRYRAGFEIRMSADYSGEGKAGARARNVLEALEPGMAVRTTVEYEQQLADVASDGTRTYRIRWQDYDFTARVGEREIAQPPGHEEAIQELLRESARVRTTRTGRTIDVEYATPELAERGQRFRQMSGMMPTYLPERPVAVGDRWNSVARLPGALTSEVGEMALELEHTLRRVEQAQMGPVAVIDLSGSYARLQGFEDLTGGTPMHMQATLTGSARFDLARGRFIGGEYQIDMVALQETSGVELQLTGHANGRLELIEDR